jgi:hypothetical protein
MTTPSRALIWAIHRTSPFWTYVGAHLGYDEVVVLTDKRGDGDRWLTDDFYAACRRFRADGSTASPLLSEAEVTDVIARCRVLRWKSRAQATAMALAMAEAAEKALAAVQPEVLIGFPIDSYVSDVLSRRARARGVPHFEMTASPLPGMTMLIHRGKLVTRNTPPDRDLVEAGVSDIADPTFTPSYVQGQPPFTRARFLKTLGYFRLRALLFRVLGLLSRDPLNLHYLDAQPNLGHKARWRDVRVTTMVDRDWESRLAAFPKERRVLFGLQLFPEAAIDYWLDNRALLEHEDMLVEMARRFTAAGYQIVVKDHPLQFGFRQTELMERLKAFPAVVVVPYDVSGNALLARCGVSVTATGTLGLQASLLGNVSITGDAYYASDEDFVILREWNELDQLIGRVEARGPFDLKDRQTRIITTLLRGSFTADILSFRGFNPADPNPAAAALGRELGRHLGTVGPSGEYWHRVHMSPGDGRGPGSPLNQAAFA